MSLRGGIKRKRPGTDGSSKELSPDESNVYNLIKSKGDMGIWKGDIRKELNITNMKIVDNCIKSLQLKQMIKEVSNVQAKGKKQLMAMEFEPSKTLTGGVWYQDGLLDEELIEQLKKFCLARLSKLDIATADGIRHEIQMSNGFKLPDLMSEHVKEILDNLILENLVTVVKSNGMGQFARFPNGVECYKYKRSHTKTGAFSLIPCGVCPRINHCAPDGIISPASCEYYTKWLDF